MIRKTKSREKLLFSAKRSFFDKGYMAVSIDEIVKSIGMSKATIYRHFESKDELLKAVIQEFFEDIRNRINHIQLKDVAFEEKLEEFVETLLSVLKELKPHLLKDLQSHEPILYRFFLEERARTINTQLRGLIQQGVAQGSIKSEFSMDIVCKMILSGIENLSSPEFIQANALTYDEVFKQVMAIIMKGIGK